jgi:hypothetical protein
MGYMKIQNLYKDQTVLMFKKVWALEKIHGTSAWITYEGDTNQERLLFHPGGASREKFLAIFDEGSLLEKMKERFGNARVKLHGEHYGGKIQKMSDTYGKENRFALFDIKVGDVWLNFAKVKSIGQMLGLDVVPGVVVNATVDVLDERRDIDSTQAYRNGCGWGKQREGIVIRPLRELRTNNGSRVIAKHKGENFKETKTQREVSPEQLKILEDANAIADEWVTPMRLSHIIGNAIPEGETLDMCHTKLLIGEMINDIEIEGEGELIMSKAARTAIGKRTAKILLEHLKSSLKGR